MMMRRVLVVVGLTGLVGCLPDKAEVLPEPVAVVAEPVAEVEVGEEPVAEAA